MAKYKALRYNLALIGIVIAILLYRPDVIVGIGQIIADLLPGSEARTAQPEDPDTGGG